MSDQEQLAMLRAEARTTRAQVAAQIGLLEESVNIPARIRRGISANPVKSAALAAAGGFAAVKVVPLLLKLTRKTWVTKLATSVATTVGIPLLTAYAQRLTGSAPHDPSARY